jgi:hypothetical protein
MRLFSSSIRFKPIDPLGDGLGDFIARERADSERIELTEYIDAVELQRQWDAIYNDVMKGSLQHAEE